MKKLIPLLVFTLSIHFAVGQNWNRIYELDREAEFLIMDKQFDKAAKNYISILKELKGNANVKFRIGYCLLNTDANYAEAIPYLEEASQDVSPDNKTGSVKETQAPIESIFLLGNAYRITNQLGKAKEMYAKYKLMLKPDDELIPLVDQYIKSCDNAAIFQQDPILASITHLGDTLNDPNSNFNPVISGDGNTIAFTSITRLGFEVHVAQKVNNTWGQPKKIGRQLRVSYLKTTGLSYDGTALYLSVDDPRNADIYVSKLTKNKWSGAEKLDKTVNSKYNETHASVSRDGQTLYFASDRKGGAGGLDIYRSKKDAKGKWGEAESIAAINTKFNETSPFLTPDGKYLYFASEGHNSMGGFDIFYIDINSPTKVVNLGYPVNNTKDNQFYSPIEHLKSGLVATHDANSVGQNDVYKVTITPSVKLVAEVSNSVLSPISLTLKDEVTGKSQTYSALASKPNTITTRVPAGSYSALVTSTGFTPFVSPLSIPENYSQSEFKLLATLKEPEKAPVTLAQVSEPATTAIKEEVKPTPVPAKAVEQPKAEEKQPETRTVEAPKKEPQKAEPEVIVKPKVEPKKEAQPKPKEKKVAEAPKPAIEQKPLHIKADTSSKGAFRAYTVQLLALKNPVNLEFFENDFDVTVTLTKSDSLYRYTTGIFKTLAEANEAAKLLREAGYISCFVKGIYSYPSYTIQLMALVQPADPSIFANLPEVSYSKGSDKLFRYTYGRYESREEALTQINDVKAAVNQSVFVKRTGK
ncbi:MAG: PD40 domain-containing protein [Bacteroidales bacterium]|nr:PD40 domain-containing protein [Bacteroidales bacterium]MBN2749333.1 PD40 domain-containing protein [Bacteroidales bacterium]